MGLPPPSSFPLRLSTSRSQINQGKVCLSRRSHLCRRHRRRRSNQTEKRDELRCGAFLREDTFPFGSVFPIFVSAQMICPLCLQNQVAMSKSHQQVSRVPFSQIAHPTTWLVRSLSPSALSLEISFPFVSRLVAVAPIGESNKSTGCRNDVELKMSLSNEFHNYLSFEDMWINLHEILPSMDRIA